MKKILFAIFAIAARALTSCEPKMNIMDIDANALDNTEFKCWKYTIKNYLNFKGEPIYAWDTEHNVVVLLQGVYKLSGEKAVVSYERTPDGDPGACDSHNSWNE